MLTTAAGGWGGAAAAGVGGGARGKDPPRMVVCFGFCREVFMDKIKSFILDVVVVLPHAMRFVFSWFCWRNSRSRKKEKRDDIFRNHYQTHTK